MTSPRSSKRLAGLAPSEPGADLANVETASLPVVEPLDPTHPLLHRPYPVSTPSDIHSSESRAFQLSHNDKARAARALARAKEDAEDAREAEEVARRHAEEVARRRAEEDAQLDLEESVDDLHLEHGEYMARAMARAMVHAEETFRALRSASPSLASKSAVRVHSRQSFSASVPVAPTPSAVAFIVPTPTATAPRATLGSRMKQIPPELWEGSFDDTAVERAIKAFRAARQAPGMLARHFGLQVRSMAANCGHGYITENEMGEVYLAGLNEVTAQHVKIERRTRERAGMATRFKDMVHIATDHDICSPFSVPAVPTVSAPPSPRPQKASPAPPSSAVSNQGRSDWMGSALAWQSLVPAGTTPRATVPGDRPAHPRMKCYNCSGHGHYSTACTRSRVPPRIATFKTKLSDYQSPSANSGKADSE